jgi:hypothetical protein
MRLAEELAANLVANLAAELVVHLGIGKAGYLVVGLVDRLVEN